MAWPQRRRKKLNFSPERKAEIERYQKLTRIRKTMTLKQRAQDVYDELFQFIGEIDDDESVAAQKLRQAATFVREVMIDASAERQVKDA